ncbi:MAG: 3-phosphoserine/phosphohydroxythreonine transaminase [Bacteroidetes bacterium]|jgi:phosphoserine aminotransferase|nr:3-phosphoserine/phosphohydroxythreonine transaminase [Bacteroidota bacterium]
MKKHNFYAGPSILSDYTIKNTAKGILGLDNAELSIMEISHRSKECTEMVEETISLFRELLSIPKGYSVLFLGGGASTQFCMVPYNYLNKKAAYIDSGSWSGKAIKEARFFGEVEVVASSEDRNYCYIPKKYDVPKDIDYLHITTNNTIFGTQYKKDPDVKVPMAADMSSDIFSRYVDISKYDIIYGGAQKNLGPAGVTFVIIKDDSLGRVERPIPSMLNYKTHIDKESMYNTPPVVNIFACLQTLKWYRRLGGVQAIQKYNEKKAGLLYDEIDRNRLFKGTADKKDRSDMNITFVMNEEFKELQTEFLEFASNRGMVGIKGHRSVGGFRASTYNAMPIDSVMALVEVMQEYEKGVLNNNLKK